MPLSLHLQATKTNALTLAARDAAVFTKTILFGLSMRLMLTAERAELLEFETLGSRLFILRVAVVPALAFVALQLNNFARHNSFPS
jgi:hypothetical protein